MEIKGSAASILSAERVALNFTARLAGIATLTAAFVAEARGTRSRITCTRKTTPGLRLVEKQAVLHGGGFNHRFSLSDAILIKDNHIAAVGGIRPALRSAKAHASHMVRVEIEVDRLEQLAEVLDEGGATARMIADQLGHSRVSMTQDVYLGRRSREVRVVAALELADPTESAIRGAKRGLRPTEEADQ